MIRNYVKPGQLVVKKIRWELDSIMLGVVVSIDASAKNLPPARRECLVMWTGNNKEPRLTWHYASMLLPVNDTNVEEIKLRCSIA
mgnify:CR=1 FL=1